MLNVVNHTDWSEVPGTNTYFTTSDVTPRIDGNDLHIYNARGQGRSWGTPKVNSQVQALADDVLMVKVTGWHKHTIRPVGGSFYFVLENGEWVRRTANYRRVKEVLNK